MTHFRSTTIEELRREWRARINPTPAEAPAVPSDAAPSEDFAGLVRALVAAIVQGPEFRTARSALLAHGARLEGEIKRLRGELAQRDAALAQAATAGPVSVPQEVRALSEAVEDAFQEGVEAGFEECLRIGSGDHRCLPKDPLKMEELWSRSEAKAALLAQQTPGDAP